jgi:23S rRNA maturation mini-RNase III
VTKPCVSEGARQGGLPCRALPMVLRPQKHWNAVALAKLGDSVFESRARLRCMFPPAGSTRMQQRLVYYSTAEAQVLFLLQNYFLWTSMV